MLLTISEGTLRVPEVGVDRRHLRRILRAGFLAPTITEAAVEEAAGELVNRAVCANPYRSIGLNSAARSGSMVPSDKPSLTCARRNRY
jgi:hypothetical protein